MSQDPPSTTVKGYAADSGLGDELIIRGVRPDPEPHDPFGPLSSQRSVRQPDADRPQLLLIPDPLEMQRGMARIGLDQLERLVR